MQHNNVLILDFGSQYTQLIARRVRELNIYCEIHPYNHLPEDLLKANDDLREFIKNSLSKGKAAKYVAD